MGISNSCLPVLLNTFHSRHSTWKDKDDIPEVFNYQNNLIDINKASEDELLLLPGIHRSLAREIIYYRNIHQGFKQMDDLIQVNGMTLEIFKRIYYDIIVDLPVSSETKQELVNLNLASYGKLCSVRGLTPMLVKRIIQRRERKGPFRFIEDLLKIKGIDYIVLATVRPYVTVHQPRITIPKSVSDHSMSYRTTAMDALSIRTNSFGNSIGFISTTTSFNNE